MAREAWEEVSFQVFTDMGGVLRSGYYPTGAGTVEGNIAVDFVWGNVPLQPDDDRNGETTEIGGGSLDYGWLPTFTHNSETLNDGTDTVYYNNVGGYSEVGNNHVIATTGWANFPGFLPNYPGDGDTAPEVVVPNFLRKTIAEANDLAEAAGVNLNTISHILTVNHIQALGEDSKTIRVSAWDLDVSNWSNSHNGAYLLGLHVGDQLSLSVEGESFGPFDFSPYVTVTAVNVDGEDSWFEFVNDEAVVDLDEAATGTAYAGPNLVNVITTQRSNTAGGAIVDEGRWVNTRYFAAP